MREEETEGLQKEGKKQVECEIVGNSADKEGDNVRDLVAPRQSVRGSELMIR